MKEFSEKAKSEFRRARNIKYSRPDLTPNQVITFAKLIATNASAISFEAELDMSLGDIQLHKSRTGIMDDNDAKRFLNALAKSNEPSTEDLREEAQDKKKIQDMGIIPIPENKDPLLNADGPYNMREMQNKMDEKEKEQFKTNMRRLKEELAKRQKDSGVDILIKKDFRVEEDLEQNFIHSAKEHGVNFLIDRFGVERHDIISELKRLKVSLDEVKR
jgi:hypothetical protein